MLFCRLACGEFFGVDRYKWKARRTHIDKHEEIDRPSAKGASLSVKRDYNLTTPTPSVAFDCVWAFLALAGRWRRSFLRKIYLFHRFFCNKVLLLFLCLMAAYEMKKKKYLAVDRKRDANKQNKKKRAIAHRTSQAEEKREEKNI